MNNLEQEQKAISDYIKSRWENVDNIEAIVEKASKIAFHDARAWFDDMEVFRSYEEEVNKENKHEKSAQFFLHSFMNSKNLKDQCLGIDGKWDYERKSSSAYANVISEFPQIQDARPVGWEEAKKNYNDFDGMEEYCKNQQSKDEEDFKGELFDHINAPQFFTWVALPYVLYDDLGQGRSAPKTLISGIYSHFLSFKAQENTLTLMSEIKRLLESIKQGSDNLETDNILLKLMSNNFEYKEEIPETVERVLSEDDKKANEEFARKMISDIKENWSDYEKKKEKKDEAIRTILRQHFDSNSETAKRFSLR